LKLCNYYNIVVTYSTCQLPYFTNFLLYKSLLYNFLEWFESDKKTGLTSGYIAAPVRTHWVELNWSTFANCRRPDRQFQSSIELSPCDAKLPVGLVFILCTDCTAPFLSVHRYYRLLTFAPLLSLHAPGPSHRGVMLLNLHWHLFGRRRLVKVLGYSLVASIRQFRMHRIFIDHTSE